MNIWGCRGTTTGWFLKIDDDPIEGLTLAFVVGDGISEGHGELGESDRFLPFFVLDVFRWLNADDIWREARKIDLDSDIMV